MYRIYTNNMPHIQNWHEFLSDVFHSTTCREFVLKKRKKQRLSGAAVYFPVCVTVQTSVVPTVTHGCWLFPFQSFWFFFFQPGFVNTTEVSLLKVFKSQVGTFPFRWGMGGVGGQSCDRQSASVSFSPQTPVPAMTDHGSGTTYLLYHDQSPSCFSRFLSCFFVFCFFVFFFLHLFCHIKHFVTSLFQ